MQAGPQPVDGDRIISNHNESALKVPKAVLGNHNETALKVK
jgi:hypothetical protein